VPWILSGCACYFLMRYNETDLSSFEMGSSFTSYCSFLTLIFTYYLFVPFYFCLSFYPSAIHLTPPDPRLHRLLSSLEKEPPELLLRAPCNRSRPARSRRERQAKTRLPRQPPRNGPTRTAHPSRAVNSGRQIRGMESHWWEFGVFDPLVRTFPPYLDCILSLIGN
jgi:hypothetical protein